MNTKETLLQAQMRHVKTLAKGKHVLQAVDERGSVDGYVPYFEVWYASKNHASYGIIYGNTHLEFGYTMKEDEARSLGLLK